MLEGPEAYWPSGLQSIVRGSSTLLGSLFAALRSAGREICCPRCKAKTSKSYTVARRAAEGYLAVERWLTFGLGLQGSSRNEQHESGGRRALQPQEQWVCQVGPRLTGILSGAALCHLSSGIVPPQGAFTGNFKQVRHR